MIPISQVLVFQSKHLAHYACSFSLEGLSCGLGHTKKEKLILCMFYLYELYDMKRTIFSILFICLNGI